MNEHEHEPGNPDQPLRREPEHAADRFEATPDLDNLDPKLLEDALDQMLRYTEAAGGFEEAFLAYLELDLPEPSKGEAQDFLERYLGFDPDRETFVRERLTNLGWTAALRRTLTENGIWPEDVRWNGFALWDHFSRMYGLVERLGGVHAFRR